MALPITGDATQNTQEVVVATHNEINVVPIADLLDVDNPINDNGVSGKKAGSMLIGLSAGAYELVIAQGPLAADDWHKMGTDAVYAAPV